MLEINSKSKAKCLKKVILEKKGLEGSQMILFKQTQDQSVGIKLEGGPKIQKTTPQFWVPFSEQDNDTPVKDFQNIAIAFKIYLDISIKVEGRSFSFKQDFQVDPKDIFEATLRQRTKTWNLFMSRGRTTCIVKVEYKRKNVEDGFIPPDHYSHTFEQLGITSGAKLVIIEMKSMPPIPLSEGQESEMEEMEDEQDEGDVEQAAGDQDEDGQPKVNPDHQIPDANDPDKAQLSGAQQEPIGFTEPSAAAPVDQQAATGPATSAIAAQGQSQHYFS